MSMKRICPEHQGAMLSRIMLIEGFLVFELDIDHMFEGGDALDDSEMP